jgi:hypothetical protein
MITAGPGRLRFRARRAIILLLFLFLSALTPRPAGASAGGPDKEHRLKAVFLYRFAQFVDWPAESFAGESAPLVLGILGPDPFGAYLDDVVKGEKVGSHSIVVKRIENPEAAADCHVLFISMARSDPEAAEKLSSALKGRRILTVGETEGFSEVGGMILFTTRNGKIRLRINMESVRASNLELSSKLLRLADIAPPSKE